MFVVLVRYQHGRTRGSVYLIEVFTYRNCRLQLYNNGTYMCLCYYGHRAAPDHDRTRLRRQADHSIFWRLLRCYSFLVHKRFADRPGDIMLPPLPIAWTPPPEPGRGDKADPVLIAAALVSMIDNLFAA